MIKRRSKWHQWVTEPYHEVLLEEDGWALLKGPEREDYYPAMIGHWCKRNNQQPVLRMENGEQRHSCFYCGRKTPDSIQVLWDFLCMDAMTPSIFVEDRYEK